MSHHEVLLMGELGDGGWCWHSMPVPVALFLRRTPNIRFNAAMMPGVRCYYAASLP